MARTLSDSPVRGERTTGFSVVQALLAGPRRRPASGRLAAVARSYDRNPAEMRPVSIEPGFVRTATGSCLYEQGETRVICTATVEDSVPRWMEGRGTGWVTAEYGMLPASTGQRKQRDSTRGRPDGRTIEIQRLIGRSLRQAVDMKKLGEKTVWIDCDVLTADGGTRCASITGAYVALALACRKLLKNGIVKTSPLLSEVAAVSVGIIEGTPILDLAYIEDSNADVDMNIVCTGAGKFIEIQGTAEREPFTREQMDAMLIMAEKGINELFAIQRLALNI